MVTLGIIITIILGFLIVNAISPLFSWTEKIGLSFPLGIGAATLIMTILDTCNFRLNAQSMMIGEYTVMAALLFYLIKSGKLIQAGRPISRFSFSNYNLLWLLFIGMIAYVEFLNIEKCMYFPTFDRDSLVGFDTIGYVAAQEHTYKFMSIFQESYNTGIHEPGSYINYAPLVQMSYAFVYMLGAETSKIICALMFLSLIIITYGAIKRTAGRTAGAIATFLMIITPEMLAFSSMSATNVIHATTAAPSIIYTAIWAKSEKKHDLILATILLGINIWTRTDGIVFIAAAGLIVTYFSIKKRQWKNIAIGACSVIPVILWTIYTATFNLVPKSVGIFSLFYDEEKIKKIWDGMSFLFTNTDLYGWAFYGFAIAILINGYYIIKKRDSLPIIIMFITAAVLYSIALYQVNYIWDTIENVLSYSAKRFLFCFVPIAWYYIATNMSTAKAFEKLENFIKK